VGIARLPKLPPADAFLHVVYDHRYFALAAEAWTRFGAPSSGAGEQARANDVLPGIGVPIRDSLLVHGRNLIDLYTSNSGEPTDILITDFGIPQPRAAATLSRFKDPIAVHVHHITAWRDVAYRTRHLATRQGATRDRPDWDFETPSLISEVLASIDEAAAAAAPWQPPFVALRDACHALLANPTFGWPAELGEKADVDSYLKRLGLS
jgi:hypothetical protein